MDWEGGLVNYHLITPPKELVNESLIWYHADKFGMYFSYLNPKYSALEGLSFGAKGSSKDMQTAIFWRYRSILYESFHSYPGIIPVASWRSKVLSKEEQREAKKITEGLKKACVDKLPEDVKYTFQGYISSSEAALRAAKESDWKKCIYDLADAYWIAQYRLDLLQKGV